MIFGSDEDEYGLLTHAAAVLTISLSPPIEGLPVIHLLGNREGMLSLANVLFWLHANLSRREFLSLTALPFVQRQGKIALSIRVLAVDSAPNNYGSIHLVDKGQQFEWSLPEDDLQATGLLVHHLACFPEHGYDRLPIERQGDAWIWLELFSNRSRTEHVNSP